jgi:hypothetical protein
MLYFPRIGVSLAILAGVLAGLMARRVEIETLLWYYQECSAQEHRVRGQVGNVGFLLRFGQ